MVEAIQFTSAAECIAHAAAIRAKFYGRKPTQVVMPKVDEPVIKIVTKEPIKRVQKPLWKTIPCMFDEHVTAYRVSVVKSKLVVDLGDNSFDEEKKTMNEIAVEVLARHPGVSMAEVKGPRRNRIVVAARMEIAYEIYTQRGDASYPAIGRFLGGRDHTTILHSVRVMTAKKATT